jgi:hypothetical protein
VTHFRDATYVAVIVRRLDLLPSLSRSRLFLEVPDGRHDSLRADPGRLPLYRAAAFTQDRRTSTITGYPAGPCTTWRQGSAR